MSEPKDEASECVAAYCALAQRLEAAHEWCILQYAQALAQQRPQVGAAWLAVGSGHAIYTGPSPFSFAVGVGMNGAVAPAEVDAIEEFFHVRGIPSAVEICPFTHQSLPEQVRQRRYGVSGVTTVLYHDLQDPLPAAAAGIEVRWAKADEIPHVVDTVAKCLYAEEPGPHRRANMAVMFGVPPALKALAFVEGELAGVASGMLPPVAGVAPFFASCTLPAFRRQGVHAALLRFRLQRVRAAGAAMALVTAMPGSDSERNLQRNGFKIAYEKQTWVKR